MIYNRPKITEAIINQINEMIKDNPGWNRTHLSKGLCELWGWQCPNGQLKDISCRDMLRALDKAGHIQLPQKTKPSRKPDGRMHIKHLCHDTTRVMCNLKDLLPLDIDVVNTETQMDEFKSLIDQYHYLKFDRTVGENMKYMVRSRGGIVLSCLLFGSAAWACRDRDAYIGWNAIQRESGLPYMTNNTRFLILPWITVPHLASHILGQVVRRVSKDWEVRYGHELYCLETFIERGRFLGTCYKAANWRHVGCTTGRGRNSVRTYAMLPQKDVYLYPLNVDFRRLLTNVKEVM